MFIWPTVLLILVLSIFPLVASVALSLSRLAFHQGGIDLKWIGFANYQQLLFGLERSHFLGVLKPPSPIGWAIVIATAGFAVLAWTRAARSGRVPPIGLLLRLIGGILLVGAVWIVVQALASEGGRPGAVIVTLIFVFAGIALQYGLGLGLATLAVLHLPMRRFFRIVFLIPLTITPVGVGYMFLMMTDTSKGPLQPIWVALGLRDFTWVNDPWLARAAVIIGDTWQWTPFVFIVLLAALEGLDQEVKEAALVDGASRWQSFRHITVPAILPVTTTIVLIRMIEGFKIIDMPNILLGGGPGTATQSMTLEAYIDWNTLNLGRSAAIAYLLLILVIGRRHGVRQLRASPGHEPGMRNPFARRSVSDLSPPAKAGAFVLLLLWAFIVLFPIYWLFVTSFKTPYDVDKGPFFVPFVDFVPTLDAWRYILVELGNDTLRPYTNTVIVGLTSSVIALILGSCTAYALVRFTYRPRVGMIGLGHRLGGASASSRPPSGRPCCSRERRRSRSSRSSDRRSGGGSRDRSATATSRSGSSRSGSCRRSRWRSRCMCCTSRSGCSTTSRRSSSRTWRRTCRS